MDFIQKYIITTILYQQTENEIFDNIVYITSFFMEIAAVFCVLLLILFNTSLKKRTRPMDRMLFAECILVLSQNILDILLIPLMSINTNWAVDISNFALLVNEVLYFLIILQWLICIDYSLHHSLDHIRRRYTKAIIPIVVITVFEILQIISVVYSDIWHFVNFSLLQWFKLIVEFGYIATAVFIEKRHEKQSREPQFMRLSPFIIPFLIGVLFRFYDAPLLAFGIIFTYQALKRRDSFIDSETGMYNEAYLNHLAAYWDKKRYKDSSAILVSAPENGAAAAQLIKDYSIRDCYNIAISNERFVLFTESLRDSAAQMAIELLKEEAAQYPAPFTLGAKYIKRNEGQSTAEFAALIKREIISLFPDSNGGLKKS